MKVPPITTGSAIDDAMIDDIADESIRGINVIQLIRVLKMLFIRQRELFKVVMNEKHGRSSHVR